MKHNIPIKKLGILSIFMFLIAIYGCENRNIVNSESAYNLVNPFIGTGGHGHTYPGATLPFGMVQLSPDTRLDGWDGCSGYHYTDSVIYGFSHTHLSWTGVSDYGDILLMPFQSNKKITVQHLLDHNVTPSKFNKETEKASPGYYEVELNDAKVKLTSTERVGIHQYLFKNSKNNKILLDLNHRDKLLNYSISSSNNSISGQRISTAWAKEQHVYFHMEFSDEFLISLPTGEDSLANRYRILNFAHSDSVMIKVGISAVSIAGAKANLKAEAIHWRFDQYRTEAKSKWEKALSKIEVNDSNKDKLSIFYTALYHSMIVPNLFSDIDGKYRGHDQKIHQSQQKQYTVFSLWDTFRGAHPLYTIIESNKTKLFIESFLNIYRHGGRLPVWELAGNETDCMIGYHAIPVIVDAYFKGYTDFDTKLALKAMLHSAELNHLGLDSYKAKGFIASGDEAESVSKTLEYAYDDWCIAKFAKAIGQDSIYNIYIERAQNYKNLFNPINRFFQAKMNGGFTPNFDPTEVNFNFTEANAWQYSLFAPQDITGLINLHGNDSEFEKHLDELFTTDMNLSGRHQVDITGLIGQYAHGNEPSHHMAYLYNHIGKPYKTQAKVHQILTEQYQNAPDGLSGNEDCGQMSAWYVLSSMGFYSVTPGENYYVLGTPHLSSCKINLENGNSFMIKANHLSDDNFYIQSVTLNGIPYKKSFISQENIMNGGELIFEMGPKPNKKWGSQSINRPVSSIAETDAICPTPYFESTTQTFSDSLLISINSICDSCNIYMSDDGYELELYKQPFWIKNDAQFYTWCSCKKKDSKTIESNYKLIDGNRSIEIESNYSNQYSAGGNNALIDHLQGSTNFRTGFWQGYQGQDVVATVNLGSSQPINTVEIGCLQDIKSWIWYPSAVEIWTSKNGIDFHQYGRLENSFSKNQYGAFIEKFTISKKINTQYIKVKLTYPGDCPKWHLGSGGKAWLFIDEITIQ